MLKLKLQYFGYMMQTTDSLEKTGKDGKCWGKLKAGEEGDNRIWDNWMASPTQWTWVWASYRSWWWTGKPAVLQSLESQRDKTQWLKWTWSFMTNSSGSSNFSQINTHPFQSSSSILWILLNFFKKIYLYHLLDGTIFSHAILVFSTCSTYFSVFSVWL